MPRWLCALVLSLALALPLAAEPVQVNFVEPSASGTLAYITVYWCLGTSCTDWRTETGLRLPSDNGNGLDPKSIIFQVPLTQGQLPVTVRAKVTATDTSGNETSGVIVSHTFTE
jgi:hypothetical protein